MSYWWVNIKETHAKNISEKYIEGPQIERRYRENRQLYEMTELKAGDIIFAYFDKCVSHIGRVEGAASASLRKEDSRECWRANISWSCVEHAVRVEAKIEELYKTFPAKKYSLFNKNKRVNNIFLVQIPNKFAGLLLKYAGGLSEKALQNEFRLERRQILDAEAVEIEAAIRTDCRIDETTRKNLIDARTGQGCYRTKLEKIESKCRITGITEPALLRASHIKPWVRCATVGDRLNEYNGLLLCPAIDILFDLGYISFENNGDVLVASNIPADDAEKMGLAPNKHLNVGEFHPDQGRFLDYHRRAKFRGNLPAKL